MTGQASSFPQEIQKTIILNASPSATWQALTHPALMNKWMSEYPLEILTNWQVGQPFIIRGNWHDTSFENKGLVLQFEPEQRLAYSHLSSLSGLPDTIENRSVVPIGFPFFVVKYSNFRQSAFVWQQLNDR